MANIQIGGFSWDGSFTFQTNGIYSYTFFNAPDFSVHCQIRYRLNDCVIDIFCEYSNPLVAQYQAELAFFESFKEKIFATGQEAEDFIRSEAKGYSAAR